MRISKNFFSNICSQIQKGEIRSLGNGYQIQLVPPSSLEAKNGIKGKYDVFHLELIDKRGEAKDLGSFPKSGLSKIISLLKLNWTIKKEEKKIRNTFFKAYKKIEQKGGTLPLHGGGTISVTCDGKEKRCSITNPQGMPLYQGSFKNGKDLFATLQAQQRNDVLATHIFLAPKEETFLQEAILGRKNSPSTTPLYDDIMGRLKDGGKESQALYGRLSQLPKDKVSDFLSEKTSDASDIFNTSKRGVQSALQQLQNVSPDQRQKLLDTLGDMYKDNTTPVDSKKEILQAAISGYCPVPSVLETCNLPQLAGTQLNKFNSAELKALEQLTSGKLKFEDLDESFKALIEAKKSSEQFLSQVVTSLTDVYKSDAPRDKKKMAMDTLACIYNNPTLPEANKKEIKDFIIDTLRAETTPVYSALLGIPEENIKAAYEQFDKKLGYRTVAFIADFAQVSAFTKYLPGCNIAYLGSTKELNEAKWQEYQAALKANDTQKLKEMDFTIKNWEIWEKTAKALIGKDLLKVDDSGIIMGTYEQNIKLERGETALAKEIDCTSPKGGNFKAVYFEPQDSYPQLALGGAAEPMSALQEILLHSENMDELKDAITKVEQRLASGAFATFLNGQSELAKIVGCDPKQREPVISFDRFPNVVETTTKHYEGFNFLGKLVGGIGKGLSAVEYEKTLKNAKKRLAELQGKATSSTTNEDGTHAVKDASTPQVTPKIIKTEPGKSANTTAKPDKRNLMDTLTKYLTPSVDTPKEELLREIEIGFNSDKTPIEAKKLIFQAALSGQCPLNLSTRNLKQMSSIVDETIKGTIDSFAQAYMSASKSPATEAMRQSLQALYKNPTLSLNSKENIEKCATLLGMAGQKDALPEVSAAIVEGGREVNLTSFIHEKKEEHDLNAIYTKSSGEIFDEIQNFHDDVVLTKLTSLMDQYPHLSSNLKKLRENKDPEYSVLIEAMRYAFLNGTTKQIKQVEQEIKLRADFSDTFSNLNKLKGSKNPADAERYENYTTQLRTAIAKRIDGKDKALKNLLADIGDLS